MFLIECLLTAIAALAVLIVPSSAWPFLENLIRGVQSRFERLGQQKALAVFCVGGGALLVRLALLPILPIPQPAVTDEFSHLLMADTFAHGRLTNPTPPFWQHFESFAITQRPTYCSAFYPAPSLFLALGQLLGGSPFWGLWLSVGLMCAAICWALQAWLPPQWALLGGLLALIRLGTFSYWANSYDGGSVAAIGGALMLGALPRIRQNQRVFDALLMGLGAALVANSRPYEGLFFSAPIFIALALWVVQRNGTPVPRKLIHAVVPLSLVLLATVIWMGYYFRRTTGSPLNTPYLINARTYFVSPNFPWSHLNSHVHYNHAVMEKFYRTWPVDAYNAARLHPILIAFAKAVALGFFFLGPLLLLPILLLGIVLPRNLSFKDLNASVRFLLLVCGTTFFGCLLPIYFNPHYVAPMTCAIYGLVLFAMKRVASWRPRGRPVGMALMAAVPLLAVVLLFVRAAAGPLHVPPEAGLPASWWRLSAQNLARARVLAELEHQPEKQLVIVRYSPSHYVNVEWVYNRADIERAKVVWARDMGDRNAEIVRYFRDRKVWLLEPDYNPPKLTRYAE